MSSRLKRRQGRVQRFYGHCAVNSSEFNPGEIENYLKHCETMCVLTHFLKNI